MIQGELECHLVTGIAKEYVHVARSVLIYIVVLPISGLPELKSPPLFDKVLGVVLRGILLFEFGRHHL
jgi:hypothetical protein